MLVQGFYIQYCSISSSPFRWPGHYQRTCNPNNKTDYPQHFMYRGAWSRYTTNIMRQKLFIMFGRITHCCVKIDDCNISVLLKCASCNRWSYSRDDKSTSCSSRPCHWISIYKINPVRYENNLAIYQKLTSKYFSRFSTNSCGNGSGRWVVFLQNFSNQSSVVDLFIFPFTGSPRGVFRYSPAKA